ncbi:hypothetical protein PMAYCL1PPCAC_17331, partial [Pristionchus mayeri]
MGLGSMYTRVDRFKVDCTARKRKNTEILYESDQSNEQFCPRQSLSRALPLAYSEGNRTLHEILREHLFMSMYHIYAFYLPQRDTIISDVSLRPESIGIFEQRIRFHHLEEISVHEYASGHFVTPYHSVDGGSVEEQGIRRHDVAHSLNLVYDRTGVGHLHLVGHASDAVSFDVNFDLSAQFILNMRVGSHQIHRPSQRRRR